MRLEQQWQILTKQVQTDKENIVKEETRLTRISKRLLNESRRAWAIRVWAAKELSVNVVFVLAVIGISGFVGIAIGVNAPDGVLCPKSSLCDRLRVHDLKLTY